MYDSILDPSFRTKAETLLKSDKRLDQFLGGFCLMEADIVFNALGDTNWCNNTTLERFYTQLTDLITYCEGKGDRSFRVYMAMCRNTECNTCDKKSFVFVANHTGNYIGLTFTMENDTILQFKECVAIRTPVALRQSAKRLYLSELPF